MKKCKKCEIEKDESEFVKIKGKWFEGTCKVCRVKGQTEKERNKNRKTCPVCGTKHNNYNTKECSTKCKILNGIQVVGGCWEWQGKVGKNGYGFMHGVNEKQNYDLLAHRKSYEVFNGPIPEGKCVCHSCDNRKCVNPDHLWVGTNKENQQDCAKKGRTSRYFYGNNPNSTLSVEEVTEIRDCLKKGIGPTEIAEKYGLSRSCIYHIKYRKSWKDF